MHKDPKYAKNSSVISVFLGFWEGIKAACKRLMKLTPDVVAAAVVDTSGLRRRRRSYALPEVILNECRTKLPWRPLSRTLAANN
jgi:hypothetical protein